MYPWSKCYDRSPKLLSGALGQTCSSSDILNSSVKIEPAGLNNMDTSEAEVLGAVHVRKRKRQSQPSDLATKFKSKPQEIQVLNEEAILGHKEAAPKAKPTERVTFSATPTVPSASKSKKSKHDTDPKRTVIIYGMESSFTKKMLKVFYSRFGNVESVKIFPEGKKEKKMCIGYVTFATEHQCNKVIAEGPKLYHHLYPGLLLHPVKAMNPPLTPPPNTPILSATRIDVKGICVSTSAERKHVKKYLRSYFRVFGAIQEVVINSHYATITFKSPAAADLCLQQNNHTICGKVCEVKRAKASKTEKKQLRETIQQNVPTSQDRHGPCTTTTLNISPPCVVPKESNSESIKKNVPTSQDRPEPSTATSHPQPPTLNISSACAVPYESNTVTVSGLDLKSLGAQSAAKVYLPDYFEKFGKVISVALISDSEATIIFRDSTSVEKCVQTGTIKIGDRECKVTRSSVQKKKVSTPALAPVPAYSWQQNSGVRNLETSGLRHPDHAGLQPRDEVQYIVTLNGANAHGSEELWGQSTLFGSGAYPTYSHSDQRLPYHTGLQPRNEMPNEIPFNAGNFNADLNNYYTSGARGTEESWGQSASFSYPTYSGPHLPYNPSLPLHYEMPYHGPAMLSFNGNDNQPPPPGPLTSYYHPTQGSNF
ncbi:RNA recognition motif domain-containing protein [Ditylenchus destructor]|nr:RNA recognition motif domain-containing protein [Ditylenchus destructor]